VALTLLRKQSIFRPSLDNLHDPYLKIWKKAVERISNRKRRKYSCFGDYDVMALLLFRVSSI
jgi:hypothetical protein